QYPELRKQLWKGHLWNPSYYVGTCGDVTKEVIQKYIATQKVM
ncbi:MAG: transposase, partial [Methanoculleus sp.]